MLDHLQMAQALLNDLLAAAFERNPGYLSCQLKHWLHPAYISWFKRAGIGAGSNSSYCFNSQTIKELSSQPTG
jgi:hypothetical protein